jgi:hypothetical protein
LILSVGGKDFHGRLLSCKALKMVVLWSSETLVRSCKSTRSQNPEDHYGPLDSALSLDFMLLNEANSTAKFIGYMPQMG